MAWSSVEKSIDRPTLDRMTDVLRHRGPDGRGTHWERHDDGSGIALGHRRLSIIDLASGRQPMCNEDGSVRITFNGEIYNYRELRRQLTARGHVFRTDSDTETIVHLYEEHGADCVLHLRGMFAFAIWDSVKRTLFFARDRLGQKPLVYHETAGRLAFASEIKSLLQIPGMPRKPDPEAIDLFLAYSYVPHPWTMFSGIRKLPPAHRAIYRDGRLTVSRYWHPDLNIESDSDEETLREQLQAELQEAVRLRLRSDVPLGAFLSGGIDSTAIVGLMQRNLPRPARTFTIGFPVTHYDESAFAQQAADHLGTNHSQFQVESDELNLLPTLAWHFDEPFADSSAIPTYRLAEVTKRHVKVALTGDGGDELFAGYPRYRTVDQLGLADSLPRLLRRCIFGNFWRYLAGNGAQRSLAARLAFRMHILREPPEERYIHWLANFQTDQRQSLYSGDFQKSLDGADARCFILDAMRQCGQRRPGTRAMLTDLQTYLPCDLLTKVDITSMAHGLECRSPFLDHRVVELAMAIPFRHHMRGGDPKPMITGTFSEFFPPSLRKRPKMGFSVPLDNWFRGPLRDQIRSILLDGNCTHGFFRQESIGELVDQHASGRWNHGERLWALLCFEQWHHMFIDSSVPPVSPPTDSPFENVKPPANLVMNRGQPVNECIRPR